MEQSKDECVQLVTQAKNALVDYVSTLDKSLIESQTLTIKNILEVINTLTEPEAPKEPSERGFFGYILLPVTFTVSVVSSIGSAVYASMRKQLSDDRSQQLRYASQMLSLIEETHEALSSCSNAEVVDAVEIKLLECMKAFYEDLEWLCGNDQGQTRNNFKVGEEIFTLKGMKNSLTDNSDLAGKLKQKVLDVFELTVVQKSIRAECIVVRERATMLAQTQRELEDTQGRLLEASVALDKQGIDYKQQLQQQQAQLLEASLTVDVQQKELKKQALLVLLHEAKARYVEEKAQTHADELRQVNNIAMQKLIAVQTQNAQLQELSEKQKSWYMFTGERSERVNAYSEVFLAMTEVKQQDSTESPILTALKEKKSIPTILGLVANGWSVNEPDLQQYLSQQKETQEIALLKKAGEYNLETCFDLIKAQNEAGLASGQLSKSMLGRELAKALKRYTWCADALTVMFDHGNVKNKDIVMKLRSRSPQDLDQVEQKLRSFTQLDEVQQLQLERLLAQDVANFYLECLKHVRMIKTATNTQALPFAEHMILKALAPKIQTLTEQMKIKLEQLSGGVNKVNAL